MGRGTSIALGHARKLRVSQGDCLMRVCVTLGERFDRHPRASAETPVSQAPLARLLPSEVEQPPAAFDVVPVSALQLLRVVARASERRGVLTTHDQLISELPTWLFPCFLRKHLRTEQKQNV